MNQTTTGFDGQDALWGHENELFNIEPAVEIFGEHNSTYDDINSTNEEPAHNVNAFAFSAPASFSMILSKIWSENHTTGELYEVKF